MDEITGTFSIDLAADGTEADGGVGRMSFTKQWSGGLSGTSHGVLLSAGDPTMGAAGYVVAEVFHGTLGEELGSFTFLQLGTMGDGEQELAYIIAPGSATGELGGLVGSLEIDLVDGTHHYRLIYSR